MAFLYSPSIFWNEWTSISIGGRLSPGVCRVKGASRIYNWDKKKGPGAQGAVITYRGSDLSEFTLEWQLWDEDMLAEWEIFVTVFDYDATKGEPKPVIMVHPSLQERRIKSAVAKKVGTPEHQGGGLFLVTVDCMQYAKPPAVNTTKTPAAATNKPKAPFRFDLDNPPPPAKSQLELENERLRQQAQGSGAAPPPPFRFGPL